MFEFGTMMSTNPLWVLLFDIMGKLEMSLYLYITVSKILAF